MGDGFEGEDEQQLTTRMKMMKKNLKKKSFLKKKENWFFGLAYILVFSFETWKNINDSFILNNCDSESTLSRYHGGYQQVYVIKFHRPHLLK